MTVFKHFYESRGNGCAQQGSEFYSYRALYKIAFPPTHPQCKDLFVEVNNDNLFDVNSSNDALTVQIRHCCYNLFSFFHFLFSFHSS